MRAQDEPTLRLSRRQISTKQLVRRCIVGAGLLLFILTFDFGNWNSPPAVALGRSHRQQTYSRETEHWEQHEIRP
jgi:hypothetical protein